MTEHVTQWLNAYHDGELHGRKLAQVQAHLAECAACQADLESLKALSDLLGQDAFPALSATPEQFVAQVGLRLPRRSGHAAKKRPAWALNALPVGVFAGGVFLQGVALVSSLLLLLDWLGVGGETLAGLMPTQPLPASSLSPFSSVTYDLGVPFGMGATFNLILPILLGGIYLVWLVLWWLNQNQTEPEIQDNQLKRSLQ